MEDAFHGYVPYRSTRYFCDKSGGGSLAHTALFSAVLAGELFESDDSEDSEVTVRLDEKDLCAKCLAIRQSKDPSNLRWGEVAWTSGDVKGLWPGRSGRESAGYVQRRMSTPDVGPVGSVHGVVPASASAESNRSLCGTAVPKRVPNSNPGWNTAKTPDHKACSSCISAALEHRKTGFDIPGLEWRDEDGLVWSRPASLRPLPRSGRRPEPPRTAPSRRALETRLEILNQEAEARRGQ